MRRRRKKDYEEPENNERWLVSYADFITLLFAFFVVLFATSEKDSEKTQEFEKSVKKHLLKIVNIGGGGDGSGGSIEGTASPIASPIRQFKRDFSGPKAKAHQRLQKFIESFVENEFTVKERKKYIQDIIDDDWGVRVSLASRSLFSQESVLFKREAVRILDKLAQLVRLTNKKILLEGHSDNRPIKGGQYPSEWELSGLRATKVLRYFNKKHEIPPGKMISLAFGSQKPVVPNTTAQNQSRNDRIELLFLQSADYL